jgi:hypothetical protein
VGRGNSSAFYLPDKPNPQEVPIMASKQITPEDQDKIAVVLDKLTVLADLCEFMEPGTHSFAKRTPVGLRQIIWECITDIEQVTAP